jgi:ppGpp synthetase/RelA/SpoT-type nucleotidyltranferase
MGKSIKNRAQCRKEYQEKFELFQKLLEAAKGDVGELLDQNKIDTISTLGRVKKFDSYFKKANEGMEKGVLTDPIKEIQDIVGIRSILIFIDDLEKISTLLHPTFKIIETERKGLGNPENAFGYESDHYILQYNEVSGPRYRDLMNLKFELQVRTPLMDAWASLSHKIDYKTDAAIPTNLKRVFFGLSGMFVVADKTFQDLKNASQANKIVISENKTVNKLLTQEINLDTLKGYLSLKFPERIKHTGFDLDDDAEYSELITEIKNVGGYNQIADIDEAVEAALPIELEEEKRLSGNLPNGRRHLVGTLRGVLDLFDEKYRARIAPDSEFYKEKERLSQKLSKKKERKNA